VKTHKTSLFKIAKDYIDNSEAYNHSSCIFWDKNYAYIVLAGGVSRFRVWWWNIKLYLIYMSRWFDRPYKNESEVSE